MLIGKEYVTLQTEQQKDSVNGCSLDIFVAVSVFVIVFFSGHISSSLKGHKCPGLLFEGVL